MVIKKLVKAVEDRGLLTKDIYLTTAPFLELLHLRNALNQGFSLHFHIVVMFCVEFVASSTLFQYDNC